MSQSSVPDTLRGPFPFFVAVGINEAPLAAGGEGTSTLTLRTPLRANFDVQNFAWFATVNVIAEPNVQYVAMISQASDAAHILVKVRNVGTAGGTNPYSLSVFGVELANLM